MIQYALKCADGHEFDSWFQSASAYEKLEGARLVACAVCGIADVKKAIMTPRVRGARDAAKAAAADDGVLSRPASAAERAVAELRRKIEENADYVGMDFAAEARAMFEGDMPTRSIYGEARGDEARALVEDGIPVAPLPFLPRRKAN